MTKEENKNLSDVLRQDLYKLRKKGYSFKVFFTAVNYSSTNFYNFLRGYAMKDDDLLKLKAFVDRIIEFDSKASES